MGTTLVLVSAFMGVAALVGGVASMFRGVENRLVEDRLELLINAGNSSKKAAKSEESSLLAQSLERERSGFLEDFVSRFLNLRRFIEQANIDLRPSHFVALSLGLMAAGVVICIATRVNLLLAPLVGIACGLLPLAFGVFKRKKRFADFQKQLPDALELIARALRAGHSLGAGFKLVGDEMIAPMGLEFRRVYEEQNLGVPLEESLETMSDRIPNLDLRFFATAVILQRQTGGDLAEILDKIGNLVRDRFRIWGQVQALTGEGRISGIVLLGLPPVLFVAIYYLNPAYIAILFEDPLGKIMLAIAIGLQLLGAAVIRKIINIKV